MCKVIFLNFACGCRDFEEDRCLSWYLHPGEVSEYIEKGLSDECKTCAPVEVPELSAPLLLEDVPRRRNHTTAYSQQQNSSRRVSPPNYPTFSTRHRTQTNVSPHSSSSVEEVPAKFDEAGRPINRSRSRSRSLSPPRGRSRRRRSSIPRGRSPFGRFSPPSQDKSEDEYTLFLRFLRQDPTYQARYAGLEPSMEEYYRTYGRTGRRREAQNSRPRFSPPYRDRQEDYPRQREGSEDSYTKYCEWDRQNSPSSRFTREEYQITMRERYMRGLHYRPWMQGRDKDESHPRRRNEAEDFYAEFLDRERQDGFPPQSPIRQRYRKGRHSFDTRESRYRPLSPYRQRSENFSRRRERPGMSYETFIEIDRLADPHGFRISRERYHELFDRRDRQES